MKLISRLVTIGSLAILTFPISVFATAQESSEIGETTYKTALEDCIPGTHLIPSLLSPFGIDIHRAHIQGYDADNCVVSFSFATSQEPDVEAFYLLCSFTPAKLEQILAWGATDVTSECEDNETWHEELKLQPGRQ